MTNEGNRKGLASAYNRFHSEFWIICLIVSLGYYQATPIGFYQFRLVDLIFILSSFYCLRLLMKGGLDRKARWLISLYVLVMVVRTLLELDTVSGIESMRTLLGRAVAYLAPLIFFVVRGSRIDRRIAIRLLVIACVVSLVGQMGLLPRGEAYASGNVDLAPFVGIQRSSTGEVLEYQETTITVWRALAIGLTFALLLSKTKLWVKVFGVVGFILQYAGGGGGRSSVVFVFLVPIVLFLWCGGLSKFQRLRKLVWVGLIGTGFAAFYLWAPIGGADPVKGDFEMTHYERSSEIFTLFTGGWGAATDIGGFEGRTVVYGVYLEGILSDPSVFFFGTGLAKRSAFETPLGSAHNMILDVWSLSGLVGLIFFLIFLGYVVSDLGKLLRATPQGTVHQIVAFSFAASILYMFQWLLVQAPTFDRSFMIVFYLLAGLLKPTTEWLQENSAMFASKNL